MPNNNNSNCPIDSNFKTSNNINFSSGISGIGGLTAAARAPGIGSGGGSTARRNSVIDQGINQFHQQHQQLILTNAHNLNMEHHIPFDDNQIKSINVNNWQKIIIQLEILLLQYSLNTDIRWQTRIISKV